MSDAPNPNDSDPNRESDSPAVRPASPVFAYLQLFRAPNVFTAGADVAMGYFVTLFATREAERALRWLDLGLLVAASCLIYLSGMVLNDVFDFEVDAVERPKRPLPSGRIGRDTARWLGFTMLASGVALAWITGTLVSQVAAPSWRPGLVATLLAGCVLFYDGLAKKSPFGAVVMGACRFFNVLLGMSLFAAAHASYPSFLDYHTGHFMIAGGIGIYIVGVTVFARKEVGGSSRGMLALGVVIMACGIAMLAAFPWLHQEAWLFRLNPESTWPLGILFSSIWILRRSMVAVASPEPKNVQEGVKFCLLSLIVLDAMVCLSICPSEYAIGVLALMVPTMILGAWLYST